MAKEKSVPFAIGLNLLIPGGGYMYMKKPIIGIILILLTIAIFSFNVIVYFGMWIVLNIIMVIDMLILGKKLKSEYEKESTKICPSCAESVKREARICRFCGHSFEEA